MKCKECGQEIPNKEGEPDHWLIGHPGTGEKIKCETFEECMKKWFEGFNIPRAVYNGEVEPFQLSHKRVRDYYGGRTN